MKPKKYLLYIDILGFSEAVKDNMERVEFLYKVIDQLNVHKNGLFRTIVFSDTILISNTNELIDDEDHERTVMFACEFVQDLLLSSLPTGLAFRAILTYGEFVYQKLNNIESYYGEALIKAYNKEKNMICTGLFIDKEIAHRNTIFKTTEFDKELDFVYLLASIETLHSYDVKSFPLDCSGFEGIEFLYLEENVWILEKIYNNMNFIQDSAVRSKYIHTYHLYNKRYGNILRRLEATSFHYSDLAISLDLDGWAHHKTYSVYINNCWQ